VAESWLESLVATCCSCVEVRVTSMSSSCSVSDRVIQRRSQWILLPEVKATSSGGIVDQ
jgi:hypothetical protein